MKKKIKIVIGADHRGFELKNFLKEYNTISNFDLQWDDVGTFTKERTDYPIFTKKAIKILQAGQANYSILVCGSGIGMAIAANRYPGIYAGLVWSIDVARLAKEHDNVNVLVLASDFTTNEQAYSIVESWLSSNFKGDRYLDRLKMIDENI